MSHNISIVNDGVFHCDIFLSISFLIINNLSVCSPLISANIIEKFRFLFQNFIEWSKYGIESSWIDVLLWFETMEHVILDDFGQNNGIIFFLFHERLKNANLELVGILRIA